MTVIVTYTLNCDVCGEELDTSSNEGVDELRRFGREAGWRVRYLPTADGGSYRADVCDKCKARML